MPNKNSFGIKTLREAIKARVDETSIRDVADELGMSKSGLHDLLGGNEPHPSTQKKLVSWYVARQSEDASRPKVSKADAEVALKLLAAYVRQDRPDRRAKRMREIVKRLESELASDDA